MQRRLLAMLTESTFGQVNQLRPRLRVLHLDDIDVGRFDPGGFECLPGRVERR